MSKLLVTVDREGFRRKVPIPRTMNRGHAAAIACRHFGLATEGRRYELRRRDGTELDAIREGDDLALIGPIED